MRAEHAQRGFDGRFGPGLPRKSDGQLLFLLHLISKMRDPAKRGSRIAIVHNGSPLLTGAAGSAESEIRRHVIENDLLELEAIVALPEQLFYNTGIASYVWLLSNRKSEERRGKVQLIDARASFVKMRKSLGETRREISAGQIDEITRLHGAFGEDDERVKIVDGASFGYRTIVVEQPLRGRYVLDPARWTALPGDKPFAKLDEDVRGRLARAMAELGDGEFDSEAELRMVLAGKAADADLPKLGAPLLKALVARCLVRDPDAALMTDGHGNQIPDSDRRDTENVPLDEDVEAYPDREVRPHVPGAWCPDHQGEVGYEIPFTRLFYKYTPPRPSAEIRGRAEGTRGRDPSALGRAHRMSYPLVALKRLADRVEPGWSPPSDGLIADERDIGVLSLDAISEAGRPAWPCFEGGRPERRHTSLS